LVNGAVIGPDGNGGQVAAAPIKDRVRPAKKRKIDDVKNSATEAGESVAPEDDIKDE
jgi:hypothetical protein